MTDTPARRGPGRPRKPATTKADEHDDEPTAEDVAREKVAEAAPYLSLTPEAAAAHASQGDAAKVAIPAEVLEAEAEAEADEDVPLDRKDMVFHEDATHVGFDDGFQYKVKNGKIIKQVKKAG